MNRSTHSTSPSQSDKIDMDRLENSLMTSSYLKIRYSQSRMSSLSCLVDHDGALHLVRDARHEQTDSDRLISRVCFFCMQLKAGKHCVYCLLILTKSSK